ncbi:hypothetical protein Q765_13850 [Flavobacterium rivuli WB 3.3-2 = DSM 21788]|uniref:Uncharacterized protein n=1 Tax=Flavobacterium rivuli WB 3.3-2 = DSM 21788 TaxID=1121895 RepID=A0A0A2MC91_9FLAO|nr:hypothetical protein [Flavobacterium rivuli]KGO85910.1 hypothetical protein Q765_13850 [Flavobacterium rivuli WB 3.3-2 = DSM 21788]
MTTNEEAMVFDTLLSVPGMNDVVKIDLKISRKNVFLLNRVIKRGLSNDPEEKDSNFFSNAPEETIRELQDLALDFLEKAGLVELSEKLSSLSAKDKK